MARVKHRKIRANPLDAAAPRAPSLSEKDELFRQIDRIKAAVAQPKGEKPTQATELPQPWSSTCS